MEIAYKDSRAFQAVALRDMKIFFTIKNINYLAGTERVTSILSNALVSRGHEVGIISLIGSGEEPFYSFDERVKLYYLAPPKDRHIFPFRDLRRIRCMRKILLKENPDCVVFVDSGRSYVNVPAAKGFPTITWEHLNIKACNGPKRRLSRILAVKYTDVIVSLTKGDAADYETMFGAPVSICMPNPVTIDTTKKCSLSGKRVLAVGRLDDQKGFDMLLDAWSRIKNREGWSLRIIGSGKRYRALMSQIAILGIGDSVEILPPTKDMIKEYTEASIYAMSSRYEGLPLVLIEAMSLGLPIVSFDCEKGPRDIIVPGVTGELVEDANVEKLALSIEKLMNNAQLLKSYSDASLIEAEKYNLNSIVERWEELVKRTIEIHNS